MKLYLFTSIILLTICQTIYAQTAQDWLDKAIENAKNKDYEGVILNCNEAIKLTHRFSRAYFIRGIAKAQLGRYEDAIIDYDEGIAWEPNDLLVYAQRGKAKLNLGHYADAVADFDQAIALVPKDVYSYNSRGYAYYKLGNTKVNYQMAIEDYDNAVKLGGSSYEPYFQYRDSAMAAMDKGEGPIYKQATLDSARIAIYLNNKLAIYSHALANFDRRIAHDPKNVWAYIDRGDVKINFGHYIDAIADFDQVINLDLNYTDAYNNRAIAEIHLGRYADAITDCDEAISLNQKFPKKYYMNRNLPDVYYIRGYAYYKLGDTNANYRKAKADYDKYNKLRFTVVPYYNRDDEATATVDQALSKPGETHLPPEPIVVYSH